MSWRKDKWYAHFRKNIRILTSPPDTQELRAIRQRHVAFEVADKEGKELPQSSDTYQQYQRSLSQLHSLTGVLPAVKQLDGEVVRTGEIPVAGGTYSDVWYGTWMGDQKVSIDEPIL